MRTADDEIGFDASRGGNTPGKAKARMKFGAIPVLGGAVAVVLLASHLASAQSTEERIKQLQREQQEQRQATDRARAERIGAGKLVIQGALEKLSKSGIAFSAVGWGVPGVARATEKPCYGTPVGFWDPVAVGVRVQGKNGAECIAVALVATADTYWIEIQSAEAWCRHPQQNMIHFPTVRIDSPQTDVVYEVVTKFVLMAVSPSSYRHWTEAPLCPGTSGGREWTTPEQMK